MYLEQFKLRELPFRLNPDPQFLYLSKAHARAKAYMESTIWFADGFVVVTGEIGAGKTTLIETFLNELDRDVIVGQINQTQVSTLEFLQAVLVQFGFKPFRMKKAEALATLNQFLLEQHEQNRKIVLIIDEAQNLSMKVLEEVRLLSGVDTTSEKVLRIILVGQPELNDKLDAPELVQLAQRIRLRFHLPTLTTEETQAYIQHRLEVAGAAGRALFAPDTFETIQRFTGGTPRLINTLCDTAMLAAANENREQVSLDDVKAALGELRWREFQPRGMTYRNTPGSPALEGTPAADRPGGGDGSLPGDTGRLRDIAANAAAQAAEPGAMDRPLARILVVASHGSTSLDLPLYPGRVLVGRTPGNDLQIDSRFVSRHHCQILTTLEGSIIEDLNSTNGIFHKSKRVRFHQLSDGDVIHVGQHEILYIEERGRVRQPGSSQLERSQGAAAAPPGSGTMRLAAVPSPDPGAESTGEHVRPAPLESGTGTK